MDLKLFELSRIYNRQSAATTEEHSNLCLGIAGAKSANWLQKPQPYSFFDLKGIIETLLDKLGVVNFRFCAADSPVLVKGHCAMLSVGQENLGFLGEVRPEILAKFGLSGPVYAAELALPKLLAQINQNKKFVPPARFPAIERDISLIAPQEITSEQLISLIRKIGAPLVSEITLFDQYFGEQIPAGFRGLSYAVQYRSNEKTLTAEEIDALHKQIRRALTEELKVQVR
jgi:phenylalanyl-tRNA synthetase beta chain